MSSGVFQWFILQHHYFSFRFLVIDQSAYAYAQLEDAIIENSGAISVTALFDSTGLFAKSIEGDAYI